MADDTQYIRTKREIASQLGIPVEKLSLWADQFSDWLGVDSRDMEKHHDEQDFEIFTIIAQIDNEISADLQFPERRQAIERSLFGNNRSSEIHTLRRIQESQPEQLRWRVVNGDLQRRELNWLSQFAPSVSKLVVFGCWASDAQNTCAESYALAWLLGASEIVVVDKNEDYIRNAKLWLERIRDQYRFFQDYNLDFRVGDLTSQINDLPDNYFDLAFCRDVLYNLETIPNGLENAIKEMARVVRPGGWIVAVEGKVGVQFEKSYSELISGIKIPHPVPQNEPIDISNLFRGLGLKEYSVQDIPSWTYVFQMPPN